jgi:hypothetical protein
MGSICVIWGSQLHCKLEFLVCRCGLWRKKTSVFTPMTTQRVLNQSQGCWLLAYTIVVAITMCYTMENNIVATNELINASVWFTIWFFYVNFFGTWAFFIRSLILSNIIFCSLHFGDFDFKQLHFFHHMKVKLMNVLKPFLVSMSSF